MATGIYPRKPLSERFHTKYQVVSESGCWIWTDANVGKGYGQIYDGTRSVLAHRFSYELHNGPIPDGMFVCHMCDVRACVNPAHLFLGTCKDNLQDMAKKGRTNAPLGVKHGQSKLSEQQVREIFSGSLSVGEAAREFGVSHSTVSNIRNGKVWSSVTGAQNGQL